jgi:hypothetical protein
MHNKEERQKMKEKVLEILGVEINEEFFLKEPISSIYKPCKYRINDSLCVEIKQNEIWNFSVSIDLNDILIGKYVICKIYKPEEKETYFSFLLNGSYGRISRNTFNKTDNNNLLMYALGLTFKNPEEAISMIHIVADKVKKAYEKGQPLINWHEV